MRKGRKVAAVLTAAMLMAAVPTSAYGDVLLRPQSSESISLNDLIKDGKNAVSSTVSNTANKIAESVNLDELIKSGQLTLSQIQDMGPGYAEEIAKTYGTNVVEGLAAALNVDSGFTGPVVGQTNLVEKYHEAYKTYEESLAGIFFLYSNVGNGGITHEPVMVDIPANLSYVMEKDGVPTPYVSRQKLTEYGTYVFKLSGIENPDLPLSEQVEYKATFRFRIQDKPPVEEITVPAGVEDFAAAMISGGISGISSGSSTGGNSGSSVSSSNNNSGSSALWSDMTNVLDLSGKNSAEEPAKTNPETEPAVQEKTSTETAAETEPQVSGEPEVTVETEPETSAAETTVPQKTKVQREQRFDLPTGNYVITLENGKEITSSVPEGFVGNAGVYLSVSEGDAIAVKLFRNDEQISFVNNEAVTQYGRYRMELDGYSYFFTIASKVAGMDYYPAPVGMRFTEVRWNDEILELKSDQYAEMKEEGTYAFYLVDNEKNKKEVVLEKDIQAPIVNVTVNKSSATIQYGSDDIESVILYQNGEEVNFNGTSLQTPGTYKLVVSDGAGNETVADFTLNYQINGFGIAAILLIIATIIGGVVFVVIVKRKVKVR